MVAGAEIAVLPWRRERGRVHVGASVRWPNGATDELRYAIDEYEASALTDRADPFVTALVPLATRRGHDLRVVGGAVSPSLLSNLHRFQEVWHAWRGDPIVDVVAELHSERATRRNGAVSTFSGGVDSTYTLYRHTLGNATNGEPLEAAVMIHGVDIPRANVVGFIRAARRSRRMTDSAGVSLLTVETNLWEIVDSRVYPIAAGLASVLHLLGDRFGAGLIPSTAGYRHLLYPLGSTPMTDVLLGSASVDIVHDGAVAERFDKLAALAAWDEALVSLRFCLTDPQHHRNCGRCQKCMLALLTFRVLGVEPRCFDQLPTDDEIVRWVPSLPNNPLYVQEARTLLDEATRRGVDEPWTRALRRRVTTIRIKESVRALAPTWSRHAVDTHRRLHQWRQQARR